MPLFTGVALTGDDVKNYEIDSSSADKTLNIPASTTQGIRLRGFIAIPSTGGSSGDTVNRKIEFKERSDSSVLFTAYFTKAAETSDKGDTPFINVMLPGLGIRFESGMQASIESDYCERISVFYSGTSSASDGS